jgi:hypothetical protein
MLTLLVIIVCYTAGLLVHHRRNERLTAVGGCPQCRNVAQLQIGMSQLESA